MLQRQRAMKRIERKEYLDKLIRYKGKQVIKVITGIRRCGKSTIMEIYRDWLLEHGVANSQIVYINFEDFDFYELRNPMRLYEYMKFKIMTDKNMYVFFDEIQHVKNFPDVVNSINLKENVDIYITVGKVHRNPYAAIVFQRICASDKWIRKLTASI